MNQLSVVDLKTHPLQGVSLIEASAGTGKTYTITHLYVRGLLECGFKVNQLLVVTFTNAATQELKGRIRELIYDVWNYLSHSEIHNTEFDALFSNYRGIKSAVLLLQEALINFDEAAIYSIHGFCQRVLNTFPLETDSLLQLQIITDEKEIQQSAIRDFWRQQIVNEEVNKLRWIFSLWKKPDELLNDVKVLLGFEQEIKQYYQQLDTDVLQQTLQQSWQQLTGSWLSDENDIRNFLLQSNALNRNKVNKNTVNQLLADLKPLFSNSLPYHLPQKWDLLTSTKLLQCFKKNTTDERIKLPFFELAEKFYQLHQQYIKLLKLQILLEATQSVQQTVKASKLAAQHISFNDLIAQLSQQLSAENRSLIKKIKTLYPMAMVDEFQDTDFKQYHIFKTLYQSSGSNSEKQADSTLILIGDPKQAIYSFRGADVFTYQQARQSTDKLFTLDTNYRSSEDYIDLINQLFKSNQNAFIFEQLIQFNRSKANLQKPKKISRGNEKLAPMVSWILSQTEKPLSKGQATEYFADLCANEIADLLRDKDMLLDGRPIQAKDLTILVKTGRQAGIMKNRLAARGISSALILRDSVFATEQAAELTLLLQVLIEPSNIPRLCGLLSTDLFGWNAAQIDQFQKDNNQLVGILEKMKAYQQHWQQKGILSLFFKLMEDQRTLQKTSQYMDGERRATNWIHIVELLQQQAGSHASFSQALHWLIQQRQQVKENAENEEHQLRLESDSELVRIVTIHKSKGLQYPIIFLPFMWQVKSTVYQPKSYSYHDDQGKKQLMILDETQRDRWYQENLAEEVRLFYVAITRAIYRCYLGWGHIKGAGSSAVAHCLYPDSIKTMKYPQDLDIHTTQELLQPFEKLNTGQQVVEIRQFATPVVKHETIQQKSIIEQTAARTFSRTIQQQWRISSYSHIVTSGSTERLDRPDYDSIESTESHAEAAFEEGEMNRFSFQKGARAGNFLHDILEHQAFDRPVEIDLIEQKCDEYGFDRHWVPPLVDWIGEILNSDLNGFCLSNLKPAQTISEMEFYMTCKNLQAGNLNDLLHQYEYCRPQQQFNFSAINGFLKGFIDLVFENNGIYYIADYKSNFLGNTEDQYTESNCKEAMYDHHYHLQYLIYTLALHRFLKQRISDYRYEKHFGGVYYLFLRGMFSTAEQHHGVYFDKPPIAVIQQLDELFDNG